MKVIRRSDMVEASEAHESGVSHHQAIPGLAPAYGGKIHRMDVSVLEPEVEGRLI